MISWWFPTWTCGLHWNGDDFSQTGNTDWIHRRSSYLAQRHLLGRGWTNVFHLFNDWDVCRKISHDNRQRGVLFICGILLRRREEELSAPTVIFWSESVGFCLTSFTGCLLLFWGGVFVVCWVWVFVWFVSTLRTSSLLHFHLSQLSCLCNKPQLGEMVAHMLATWYRARISCRSPVVTFFILLDPIMESHSRQPMDSCKPFLYGLLIRQEHGDLQLFSSHCSPGNEPLGF